MREAAIANILMSVYLNDDQSPLCSAQGHTRKAAGEGATNQILLPRPRDSMRLFCCWSSSSQHQPRYSRSSQTSYENVPAVNSTHVTLSGVDRMTSHLLRAALSESLLLLSINEDQTFSCSRPDDSQEDESSNLYIRTFYKSFAI